MASKAWNPVCWLLVSMQACMCENSLLTDWEMRSRFGSSWAADASCQCTWDCKTSFCVHDEIHVCRLDIFQNMFVQCHPCQASGFLEPLVCTSGTTATGERKSPRERSGEVGPGWGVNIGTLGLEPVGREYAEYAWHVLQAEGEVICVGSKQRCASRTQWKR